ncbi:MAG: cytochrome c oxidase assembly protein [Gammaproteobacteria bacterium]|nr:cytochrome c oxidase assembly protein [Gammaproteobacteria bacterium]
MSRQDVRRANRRVVLYALGVVVGMFAFGFALVPLYKTFCTLTGWNGQTGQITQAQALAKRPDTRRWVTIEFVTNVNENMPWEFRALKARMQIHPGMLYKVDFYARNLSSRPVVGRAVDSMAPNIAARYLKKTQCFCFSNHLLKPGQQIRMPVQFILDPALPEEINTVTLSYTFFDTGAAASSVKSASTARTALTGKAIVAQTCVSCHGTGVMGAPRIGNKTDWAPRAAQGFSALFVAAAHGLNAMPPRGGNPALSDQELKRAISYLLERSGIKIPGMVDPDGGVTTAWNASGNGKGVPGAAKGFQVDRL